MCRVLDNVDSGNADCASGGQGPGGGNADESGFTGAVWAEKSKDFSLFQLQIDTVHCHYAELGLVDFGQCFNFDDQEIHLAGFGKCMRTLD